MTATLPGSAGSGRGRSATAPASLAWARDLVQPALRAAVDRLDPQLRPVVGYHLGWLDEHGQPVRTSGGKAVRPALTLLAAQAAGGQAQAAVPGAVAVELVHNFSLVHDDLMDRDVSRRHRATVWSLWGDATAVLAGDAMLSLAHEVLLECGSPYAARAGAVVAAGTRELVHGQALDMAFERRDRVSVAECEQMAAGKTGALMSASAAVGAVLAGAAQPVVTGLADYGAQVGLAFQLVDDLLGIWGDPAVTGKPVHSDLRAGKKSLPITWAVEHGGEAGTALARWLARDRDGAREPSDLQEAAGLVERSGARAWAAAQAARRIDQATRGLDPLAVADGDGADRAEALAALDQLRTLAHFVVDRQA